MAKKTDLLAALGQITLQREGLARQLQSNEQAANGIKTQLYVLEQTEQAEKEAKKENKKENKKESSKE